MASREDNHYKGRVLRPKKWKEIQSEVVGKLQAHTVLLFLDFFYQKCLELLDNNERLPGTIFFPAFANFYSFNVLG